MQFEVILFNNIKNILLQSVKVWKKNNVVNLDLVVTASSVYSALVQSVFSTYGCFNIVYFN